MSLDHHVDEPTAIRTNLVARLEGRDEELFDIGAEAFAVAVFQRP